MKRDIDGESYTVWKLPNLLLLHWVLNPGLVINELLLGQRIARESLIKDGPEPMIERTFIACPHCETLHHGRIWAGKAAFGHYNGLYCPTCEGKIPALLNVFSILILAITFPIWKPLQYVYGDSFKARSIAKARGGSEVAVSEISKPMSFVKMGVFFGVAMGAYFGVTTYVSTRSWATALMAGLLMGILMGVTFGATMWLTVGRGKRKTGEPT